MDTDELLAELDSTDWSATLRAVGIAETHIIGSIVGDPKVEGIIKKLAALVGHPKWEVRRAVAKAAAQEASFTLAWHNPAGSMPRN